MENTNRSEYKGKTISTHYGSPLSAESVERLMASFGAVAVEAATGTGPSGDVNPSVAYKAAVWSAHYAGKLAQAR